MLTPEWLEKAPDLIALAYAQMETLILIELAKNAMKKLNGSSFVDLVLAQSDYIRRLTLNSKISKFIKKTITNAVQISLKNDRLATNKAFKVDSKIAKRAVNQGVKTLTADLLEIDRKLPTVCADILFSATSENMQDTIAKLAETGIVFRKKDGKREQLDVIVRRQVLTNIQRVGTRASALNAMALGFKHVETTAHAGARNIGIGHKNHESWQGKIFEISDIEEFEQLAMLNRPVGY